ncbi:hypothetical protein Lgra_3355 [Legionella gratiana]|uniref:Uncharacterized protein n=1 Tax=Legionella gratiana TaxID=45066 RepID=A0A378JAT0_9GAMM|nr:hypothetical protein [Legionella gratiana]KTD06578.1 hypothetical protein Lgra_3355 [Legionella gratiana]STX44715.1 Uncharacterised protein [Legionella gratiana]
METITLQELVKLSKDIVTKYYSDDPTFWDVINKRINYIEKTGALEADDSENELSDDKITYILSRKYCTVDDINIMQPLFELWDRALGSKPNV